MARGSRLYLESRIYLGAVARDASRLGWSCVEGALYLKLDI